MPPQFDLTDQPFNTSFAPLCALGHALWERGELDSLRTFGAIPEKSCVHTPGEKLLDAFLVILAGYPSLYLLNTALRPDPLLAQAWHRSALADQSSVSRTLDACTPDALTALRTVSADFWRRHSQVAQHDWRRRLILDLDLTPFTRVRKPKRAPRAMWVKKHYRSPTGTGADSAVSRVFGVATVSRLPTQRQLLGPGGVRLRDLVSLAA